MSWRSGMALELNIIRRWVGIENVCLGANIDALNSSAELTKYMTVKLILIDERLLSAIVTTHSALVGRMKRLA